MFRFSCIFAVNSGNISESKPLNVHAISYYILLPFVSFFYCCYSSAGTGDDLLVGFKGGVNFSVVFPTQRFSVIQSLGGTGTVQRTEGIWPFFPEYRLPVWVCGYDQGWKILSGFDRTRFQFL